MLSTLKLKYHTKTLGHKENRVCRHRNFIHQKSIIVHQVEIKIYKRVTTQLGHNRNLVAKQAEMRFRKATIKLISRLKSSIPHQQEAKISSQSSDRLNLHRNLIVLQVVTKAYKAITTLKSNHLNPSLETANSYK